MPNQITIGEYLLDSLFSLGVEHLFSVPGDYVLQFDKLLEEHKIQSINATRENTAGYMADAYARIRGIGAVCTTYGVGINIVNSMAQAFVESVPVVYISGAPGNEEFLRCEELHHILGDATQLEIFQKITVAQAVLEDPHQAAAEIHRVLQCCIRESKPVYIELPRNRVTTLIEAKNFDSIKKATCDPAALAEGLKEVTTLLQQSKKPLIWIGHELQRFHLIPELLRFAERYRIPIVSSLLGKSCISERHPLFVGLYQGGMSQHTVRTFAENCDCLLSLGVLWNDVNTGMFSENLPQENRVIALNKQLRINHHDYPNVSLSDFMRGLSTLDLNLRYHADIPAAMERETHNFRAKKGEKITAKQTFACIQQHLKPNHIVVSDIGDCLFGSSDLIVEEKSFIANAYFASLGYGTPASVGTQLAAPKKRVIGIVGDGAFQMTCTELSTAVRYGIDPVIILLNNHGYATERPIIEGEYNDILNWNYAELPRLFAGGAGIRVTTEDELDQALQNALKERGIFHLIEVDLDKLDFSPALRRFTDLVKEAQL